MGATFVILSGGIDAYRRRIADAEQRAQIVAAVKELAIWGNHSPTMYPDFYNATINGESVTAHHVPRGHTDGDSIVHFPGSNVLHMGDTFFNGLYPYIDLDGGGSIHGMIAAAELGLSLANDQTRIIPGHGPLSNRAELQAYHDFLAQARDNVQALVDQGLDLPQAIAAKPTAEWDEALGGVWIKPEQLVTFIYNSLTGVDHYTAAPTQETDTE